MVHMTCLKPESKSLTLIESTTVSNRRPFLSLSVLSRSETSRDGFPVRCHRWLQSGRTHPAPRRLLSSLTSGISLRPVGTQRANGASRFGFRGVYKSQGSQGPRPRVTRRRLAGGGLCHTASVGSSPHRQAPASPPPDDLQTRVPSVSRIVWRFSRHLSHPLAANGAYVSDNSSLLDFISP